MRIAAQQAKALRLRTAEHPLGLAQLGPIAPRLRRERDDRLPACRPRHEPLKAHGRRRAAVPVVHVRSVRRSDPKFVRLLLTHVCLRCKVSCSPPAAVVRTFSLLCRRRICHCCQRCDRHKSAQAFSMRCLADESSAAARYNERALGHRSAWALMCRCVSPSIDMLYRPLLEWSEFVSITALPQGNRPPSRSSSSH